MEGPERGAENVLARVAFHITLDVLCWLAITVRCNFYHLGASLVELITIHQIKAVHQDGDRKRKTNPGLKESGFPCECRSGRAQNGTRPMPLQPHKCLSPETFYQHILWAADRLELLLDLVQINRQGCTDLTDQCSVRLSASSSPRDNFACKVGLELGQIETNVECSYRSRSSAYLGSQPQFFSPQVHPTRIHTQGVLEKTRRKSFRRIEVCSYFSREPSRDARPDLRRELEKTEVLHYALTASWYLSFSRRPTLGGIEQDQFIAGVCTR